MQASRTNRGSNVESSIARDARPTSSVRWSRGGLLALILGVAVLAIAGCGSDDGGSADSTVSLEEPATKPDKLTVRVWGGIFEKALKEGAGQSFTDETGIELEYDRTPDNESFTQTQTAIKAGDEPPVDVSWSTTVNGYLSGKQGLVTPLDPAVVTNLDQVSSSALPPDGTSDYVGAYTYSVPVNFLSDELDAGEFESWEALWDPKFSGQIGLCDVIICHIGLVAKLAGVDLTVDDPDMTPVWEKYRALKPNIGALTVPEQLIQEFTSGATPILIDLAASGAEAADAGANVDWATPSEGIPVDRDAFYVQSNIPDDRAYYGQVLINHVLDPANQEVFANLLGVTPVNLDAKLPAYQAERPELYPFTDEELDQYAILTPTDTLAENQSEWQAEFEKAIKG